MATVFLQYQLLVETFLLFLVHITGNWGNMELKLEKEKLINLLEVASIAGYSKETNLEFAFEGLRITSGLEDQLLVKAWYSSGFFTEYKWDGNIEIGLDCKHLNRLSKFIDETSLRVEIKEGEFLILGDYTKVYFCPFKVETEDSLKLGNIPLDEVLDNYEDVISLTDAYVYAQAHVIPPGKLRPLGGIDELIFRVDNNVLSLVQQSEGEKVRFEKIISDNVLNPSPTSVPISTKNLIAVMNIFNLWYKDITIGLPQKENYPVIFHDSCEDYEITVLVAPIMDSMDSIPASPG